MTKAKKHSVFVILFFLFDVFMTLSFLYSCFRPESTYEISYIVDGKTIATREYTVEDNDVTAPSIPEKKGYAGRWEYVELNGGNKTVKAIYTVVAYTVTFKAGGATLALYPYTVEDYADIVAPEVPVADAPAEA